MKHLRTNLKCMSIGWLTLAVLIFPAHANTQNGIPPGFVYTEGAKFMLDGREFYFSGANVYDFFTYGSGAGDPETEFMDKERIDAHMRRLYRNGVRVIRLWGFSHEEWHGFEIEKGVYNEPQFMLFDYVVKSAEANGLKLIVALENYWNDYGGIKDRLKWEGIEVAGAGAHDQGQFFINRPAIEGYKDYVQYFITRVNHYDGVEYRDDPTILAWELMNEPRYQGFGDDVSSNVLRAWVDEMGQFIKEIDPHHLLGTGLEGQGTKYGFGADAGNDFIKIHQSPYIDFTSAHPYIRESWSNFDVEMTKALICQWAEESHDLLNKPLFVGEFNVERNERLEWWEDIYGFIETKKIGGSAFWWFPDDRTPRDKFAVFEGDAELGIFKTHSQHTEAMSGGEAIYFALLSPKSGDKYIPGSSVEITANAINENNTITNVNFYANGELIGSDNIAPYTYQWTDLATGEYVVTAIAETIDGTVRSSTPRNIQVGGDIFSLEYKNASVSATSNQIKPHFQLVNNSSQDIPYEDLSIRYWFTSEQDKPLQFASDYAQLGTSYVNGRFVQVEDSAYYMEVTFDAAAGEIASFANPGRIETKVYYSDWTDFDQSNDYSYDPAITEFTAYDRVTVYIKGSLVFGQEPQGAETPTAVIAASVLAGDAPLLVNFDASGSSDPNGDTLIYTWDFGAGNTAQGVIATFEFTEIGDQDVTLTVSDPSGNSRSSTVTIQVLDPRKPPVPFFTFDQGTGIAPVSITFDASGSSDPNGDSLTYQWDFGNGDTAMGVMAQYEFITAGSYDVTLAVSDGIFQESVTQTIMITDGNPIAVFTADVTSGFAPLTVNFDASGSIDPLGNALTYGWDFGDGNNANGLAVSHLFTSPGEYNVTLTVDNGAGGTRDTSMVISVAEQPQVSDLVLEYMDAGRGNSQDNMINPHFQIVNNGGADVPYSALTTRYWFSSEENSELSYWCDWAQLGTSQVNGTFGRANGMDYLEVSFAAAAGALPATSNSGAIMTRFSKTNWSNFDETNDYSYDVTKTSFQAHDKVTLYVNGNLVWGREPGAASARVRDKPAPGVLDISFYPNPTMDRLNLVGKTFQAGDMIRVMDTNGAVSKTIRLNAKTEKVTIDMTTLPPGVYFVTLAAGGERVVRKVIKR